MFVLGMAVPSVDDCADPLRGRASMTQLTTARYPC